MLGNSYVKVRQLHNLYNFRNCATVMSTFYTSAFRNGIHIHAEGFEIFHLSSVLYITFNILHLTLHPVFSVTFSLPSVICRSQSTCTCSACVSWALGEPSLAWPSALLDVLWALRWLNVLLATFDDAFVQANGRKFNFPFHELQ